MKVKSLLAEAKKCKTDEDAGILLNLLIRYFGNNKYLSHLLQLNSESYMEDTTPFVSFEMNRVFSENFITMIRPEIRDEKLIVRITTNRMLDGKGLNSKNWETVEGLDDLIECDEDRTIANIAVRAKELAIGHHRMLIESVGVPSNVAESTAVKSW